jgi:hypothetical protein
MRYKTLVSKKLEALDNSIGTINSLLSQQNLSREQFDNWYTLIKEKIAEIQTLINTEQEG